jgi:DNA-directed RNA polymerase subunit M/transcription elongation factor TFIIS
MEQSTVVNNLSKIIGNKFAVLVENSIRTFSEKYATDNDTYFLLEAIYESKYNEIIKSLQENKILIKDNETAKNIAFMKDEELNPEKYQEVLKKKEIEEYKKNEVKSSDTYKCSKCKKSKCKITEKQTRAGDEPATTFVECLHCGHKFSY